MHSCRRNRPFFCYCIFPSKKLWREKKKEENHFWPATAWSVCTAGVPVPAVSKSKDPSQALFQVHGSVSEMMSMETASLSLPDLRIWIQVFLSMFCIKAVL